jgi:hypothetical protein
MKYDEAKIDEAVLAVLYLTAWEENGITRAWKGVDWSVAMRPHEANNRFERSRWQGGRSL